jgi:hypothetical protein
MQGQNLRPFPRSLSYFVNKLSGFRRTCVRVIPSGIADNIKPSSIMRISLPENTLLDLDSFMIAARLTIPAKNQAPKDIDFAIVQNFQVDINGVTIANIQNYNQLCEVLMSWTAGTDAEMKRNYLQFGLAPVPASPNASASTERYIALNNFPFGLSLKPSILDTSLTGPIPIPITLAPKTIQAAVNAENADYTLDQVYASVDVLSFSDDSYARLLSDFVSAGGVLEIPYTNAFSYTNSVSSLQQQMRFSLASQSVDMLVGTVLNVDFDSTTTATIAASDQTRYFTKLGGSVSSYGWEVNGLSLPSFMPIRQLTAAYNASALCQGQDVLGGHALSTEDEINANWACFQKLNVATGSDERWSSGLDTRMTNSQFLFKTTGSSAAALVMVWALTTSLVRISAGRQLEVVN